MKQGLDGIPHQCRGGEKYHDRHKTELHHIPVIAQRFQPLVESLATGKWRKRHILPCIFGKKQNHHRHQRKHHQPVDERKHNDLRAIESEMMEITDVP